MSTTETDDLPESDTAAETATEEAKPEKPKLGLDVKIAKPSACERHVTVTIGREDVERYIKEQFNEIVPKAELPGFRAGRAPRKLVERQFKNSIHEQVKGKLLMDSLSQISDEHEFSAISEPDFDFEAVKIPDDGPLVFEFDIEVRPEFDMPQWKGLHLKRPVYQHTEEDVDSHLKKLLARYGNFVELDGPVESGDGAILKVNMTFLDGDTVISTRQNEMVAVRPILSFNDAKLEGFDKLVVGKKVGDEFAAKLTVSKDSENEALRGKELTAKFELLEIRQLKLPDLDDGFLDRIGGFKDEAELRDEVRKELDRQLKYQQQKQVREQITGLLTVAATWDLPPELLRRQSKRELDRAIMELQSSGFDNAAINSHANELRRNSLSYTARALKEHFILERIAEDEKIDAVPEDYDREIELIAEQADESPRRVRARLEKKGQIDSLRNQIVERKVIDLITSTATFEDTAYNPPKNDTAAISFAIAGGDGGASIPEAKHAGSDDETVPGALKTKKSE
ncbi:MAG: trigger factor [Planctomycetales bacterium]|nr:trigger factor [Planctomycetales bacterium]